MPRTIDSMIHNSEVAAGLRAAGKSIWTYKVNIPLTETMTFEEKRDTFARGLKASRWFKQTAKDYDDELWQLWDEIKDADDIDHFNVCLDGIYDVADDDRCWLTLK